MHHVGLIEIRQIVDVREAERMTDFVRQQFIAGANAHDDLRAEIGRRVVVLPLTVFTQ
jgi:hypothetical protein